jgi:hypothetical protein
MARLALHPSLKSLEVASLGEVQRQEHDTCDGRRKRDIRRQLEGEVDRKVIEVCDW